MRKFYLIGKLVFAFACLLGLSSSSMAAGSTTFFENMPEDSKMAGFSSNVGEFSSQRRTVQVFTGKPQEGGVFYTPELNVPSYGEVTYTFKWGTNTTGLTANVFIGTDKNNLTQQMNDEPLTPSTSYSNPSKQETVSIKVPAGNYYIGIKWEGGTGSGSVSFCACTCTWTALDAPVQPDEYSLIGQFNGWNEQTELSMTEVAASPGTYAVAVSELTTEFVIRKNHSYDTKFGMAETDNFLPLKQATALVAGGKNIALYPNIQKITNAVLTFNSADNTLTINGTAVTADWFLMGADGDWNNGIKMTAADGDNGEFTLKVDRFMAADGFKFRLGDTWDVQVGAGDNQTIVLNSNYQMAKYDNVPNIKLPAGITYVKNAEFTFNAFNNTLAFKGTAVTVTGISVDQATLKLTEGATQKLVATLAPADAEGDIVWTSSDETIATVAADGTVTAVKAGTATIKAEAYGFSADCAVTVEEAAPGTTYTIALDKTEAKVEIEKEITLVATLTPAKDDATYTWTSSDETIATVKDGVVKGVKVGKATIKVAAEGAEATCEITVTPAGGVEAIFADGAVFDVYSIDGVVVLRNADAEAFRALGAGLYIVNGQKVLVK